LLLGIYCSRRAAKGDEKFALIRTFGIALGALGGTRFDGADLTHANFTNAILKSTNFRTATLTHVCWHDAQKLDRARVGDSILANPMVRELLVTRNGYKHSYVDANLRGANLNGVNLDQATLTWADLSNATLHRAHLRDANLREVLAIGADFTGAYLTGACLEGWNIDHTTLLTDVDCQYVFLLEQPNAMGHRERRPHDPDAVFQPGDFEKLYRKMINVVQVLLRNGMDRAAFAVAFQQLMAEYPDIGYDSIQAIERKGNDALVTLEVAATADKAEISRSLQAAYERLRQLEAKIETLHELRAADLKEVALTQKAQIFNQFVGGGTAMQANHDSSRNINVGGDLNLTGSTLNLGELSGTVTNTINQIPDPTHPDQPNLKDLLTQLQQLITSDTDLSDTDKADLLEQVQALATAGQTPEPTQKEGLARKAKKMFDATLNSLPETAKIVEACSKLLPMILRVLG
jgi:uncharacterized protein YjbI with pentapeptide repeats